MNGPLIVHNTSHDSSNGNIFRVTRHLCGKFTGQWRGALVLYLVCASTKGWVNNQDADDLNRHPAHYDVIVLWWSLVCARSLQCNRPTDQSVKISCHFIQKQLSGMAVNKLYFVSVGPARLHACRLIFIKTYECVHQCALYFHLCAYYAISTAKRDYDVTV